MKKNNLHKNNSGFKVPEDYFESFEMQLSKKLSSDTTKNNLLPTKIDSGFKVPEGYFDTVEDTIIQNTTVNKPKRKIQSLISKQKLLYLSGLAAMITILISITINNKKTTLNFDDIAISDIHTYLSDEGIDLSIIDIMSLVDDDINYTETFEEELINEDNLLNYLSEEDLDDEIIFTE